MNNQFKTEFKNLNATEIKDIINGCAGRDILTKKLNNDKYLENASDSYFIKYIDNENYGFWTIQWGWKQIYYDNMSIGTGFFENSIKISPFKIEFDNTNANFNPFSKPSKQKYLEEYLFVYINKHCPHYKQALVEETEKFMQMLDMKKTRLKIVDDEEIVK